MTHMPESLPKMLTSLQQNVILHRLNERGVAGRCPRCERADMSLIDNLTSLILNPVPGAMVFGGPVAPAAILACSNCGYMELHSLGALGLMDHPVFRQTEMTE